MGETLFFPCSQSDAVARLTPRSSANAVIVTPSRRRSGPLEHDAQPAGNETQVEDEHNDNGDGDQDAPGAKLQREYFIEHAPDITHHRDSDDNVKAHNGYGSAY